jgi:hypothetical protein
MTVVLDKDVVRMVRDQAQTAGSSSGRSFSDYQGD